MNGSSLPADPGNGADNWLDLFNGFCDERLSEAQVMRLSEILRSDQQARRLFIEMSQLHGQLGWDLAHCGEPISAESGEGARFGATPADDHVPAATTQASSAAVPFAATVTPSQPMSAQGPGRTGTSGTGTGRTGTSRAAGWRVATVAAVAAVVVAGIGISILVLRFGADKTDSQIARSNGQAVARGGDLNAAGAVAADPAAIPENTLTDARPGVSTQSSEGAEDSLRPLDLEAIRIARNRAETAGPAETPGNGSVVAPSDATGVAGSSDAIELAIPDSDEQIVEVINSLLARSWTENEIQPLPVAPADEWLRRAWLSFTGSIPPAEVVRDYLAADNPRGKRPIIDQLLVADSTAQNLAVIWVNLMIGRSNPGDVDEVALYEFMRQRFTDNVSWMETVCDLMSAEGRSDQNGATNFLLAHLNNQATPATAVTARLFLGQQVQCTQCHDHPFAPTVGQDEFWGLNAFFKQTRREALSVAGSGGVRQRILRLTDTSAGGMTFYETLRGQQKAVLPEFGGVRLTAAEGVDRRAELARLVKQDPHRRVAAAMVNRTWDHFFGAGFTTPIDDMGPHTPVSHPELLDFLTRAFAEKHYDVRRLMTWIALSDAWQRTSSLSESGSQQMLEFQPHAGGIPLFNQVYARHLVPEEVYDSLRTAIHSLARHAVASSWGTRHRREWVEQFVEAYGTDENDEWLQFDGNISQALLMMNGPDLQRDISLAVTQLRSQTDRDHLAANRFLPELSLATVSRLPTDAEQRIFLNRLRQLNRTLGSDQALQIAAEDMVWAYLNSSEFILVH